MEVAFCDCTVPSTASNIFLVIFRYSLNLVTCFHHFATVVPWKAGIVNMRKLASGAKVYVSARSAPSFDEKIVAGCL